MLALEYQSRAEGSVNLPGSKSIANRALLLAAMAQGETILQSVLDSDDTRHMRNALRKLGVNYTEQHNAQGLEVRIQGRAGGFSIADSAELFLGNAGTAMRPLTAALAASQGIFRLTGEERMYERPIGPLVDALRLLGADINYLQEAGYPPLLIHGASLQGGRVSIDGSLSSQFVSALLMALPLANEDTVVELTGDLVSLPYIQLTLDLMSRFGIQVQQVDTRHFIVPGKSSYQSPGEFVVEGDASSASYFLAAGAIAGGTVTVKGTGLASLQGDKAFAEILEQMGAQVAWGQNHISVSRGELQGGHFDLNAIPDAAMTIATTALFAKGPTEIRNVYNWRLKETDRLHAMATELRKTGAEVTEYDDGLRIVPPAVIQRARVATYNDHRMAMCFSLLTFAPAGVEIEDAQCCDKTYPEFFQDFSAICHN
ncbi:3-phosphoshikimate 1-carboxyvinyltransferase [Aliidiomarina minuta]|uniref:3-phosphoshikimate 1-carboxyvinyltransferase n=1 Tax=Aliidiomarina minuta TaxID=880057 RepID=A0A432WAS7_9GAMM|nr:3-phosphoshikimate 1-carboxyvinyltransferase [Aliidiomarina minuta]